MTKFSRTKAVTKAVATAGAMLVTTAATVCNAGDNPLLGHWVLSGPASTDCRSFPGLDFTATTQIVYVAASKFQPASQMKTTVHYFVNGNKVYASSTASFGNAPFYIMTGPGKMTSGDMDRCNYARQ